MQTNAQASLTNTHTDTYKNTPSLGRTYWIRSDFFPLSWLHLSGARLNAIPTLLQMARKINHTIHIHTHEEICTHSLTHTYAVHTRTHTQETHTNTEKQSYREIYNMLAHPNTKAPVRSSAFALCISITESMVLN